MFPGGPALQCVCGKSFLQHAALNHHTRTCARTKKRITRALSKAKQVFEERRERKRQRQEESVAAPNDGSEELQVVPTAPVSLNSTYFSQILQIEN
jgi:hypothetical protein